MTFVLTVVFCLNCAPQPVAVTYETQAACEKVGQWMQRTKGVVSYTCTQQ